MPNFKKTRGFSLRSGNKPNMSSFKMMGSTLPSPITSPYKNAEYDAALAKDPNLEKHIAERNKHKKGSAEYEAEHAKINAAYGKERNQTTLAKDQANLGETETKEETEVSTGDAVESIKGSEDEGSGSSVMGKIGKGAKGALGAAFQGLTHGLDAVYGTGKVNTGNSVTFSEPKKKKDDETGEQKVNKLINKEA